MLLCDGSIQEAGTNKLTLLGLFGNWSSATFPVTFPPFRLYARVTDMNGNYVFRIDVVELETDTRIATLAMPSMNSADPLQCFDITLIWPMITFQRPGRYEFQLHANDEFIGRTTANVHLLTEAPAQ